MPRRSTGSESNAAQMVQESIRVTRKGLEESMHYYILKLVESSPPGLATSPAKRCPPDHLRPHARPPDPCPYASCVSRTAAGMHVRWARRLARSLATYWVPRSP